MTEHKKCPKCGKDMSYFFLGGGDKEERGFKCFPCAMTPKQKKELAEIKKEVDKITDPLYKRYGVNKKTEDLHWTNGEVYIVNKKTGKRREIGAPQATLNVEMLAHAIVTAKEIKMKVKKK